MKEVKPEVYLINRPFLDWSEVERYLASVGGGKWTENSRESPGRTTRSFGSTLIEFMGRLCYRSWAPKLNPNVSRIREDQDQYLDNILQSLHGSVLEHANYSFVFSNVSRVFTHELVRHRAGTAISQESLRYVRLTEIPIWLPDCLVEKPHLRLAAEELIAHMERYQQLISDEYNLDDEKSFATKKHVTSAMRRLAPDGVATSIGWTANIRTLRWVIEQRTSLGAEEEMRMVFREVARIMKQECPQLFHDFTENDQGEFVPTAHKV